MSEINQTHKWFIVGVTVSLFLIAFTPTVAKANEVYSGCDSDNLDRDQGVGSPSWQCADSVVLSEDMYLESIIVDLRVNNVSTDVSVDLRYNAAADQHCYVVSGVGSLGTGLVQFTFEEPVLIEQGTLPTFGVHSGTTCSGSIGSTLQQQRSANTGLDFNTRVYQLWNWQDTEFAPGGTGYGLFSDSNTRFLSVDYNSLGSGVVQFDVEWYLDPDEVDTSNSITNPSQIRIRYAPATSTTLLAESFDIDPTTTGTSSDSFAISALPDGTYTALISFSNFDCGLGLGACPFPDTYAYLDFTLSGGVITASSSPEIYLPADSADGTGQSAGSGLSGAIKYAFYKVFYDKHPFAWILDTMSYIQELAATPQTVAPMDVTLDFGIAVNSATTSGGYFDFEQYQEDIPEATEAQPIVVACGYMDFESFDTCGTFRTVTQYMLYLALMAFIAILGRRLINQIN